MIAVVENDNPPLHLVLGSDAIGLLEKKQAELMDNLNQWRTMSQATAFEGVTVAAVGG